MNRKRLALGLAFAFLGGPGHADLRDADMARQVQVYVYRPEVFADLYLQRGIPDSRVFRSHLWYIRLEESLRVLSGMENLAQFVRSRQIPGVDFSGHRRLTTAEMERFFRSDLWISSAAGAGYKFLFLNVKGTLLEDRALPTIGKLFDLEVLELNDRLTDEGVAWLKNLARLKVLGIASPQVTDRSAETLSRLRRLERLRLGGTSITDRGLEMLTSLPLRQLDLGAQVTDRGVEILSAVKTLEHVDLSQARVTQRALAALAQMPAVHTLFLGPSISDADLAPLPSFKNLKRLDLTGARVSDAGAAILAHGASLEELALTRTQVTGATLEKLSRLPNLRYLEISDTRVTPDIFKSLGGFPSLQVLSFSTTKRLAVNDVKSLGRWPRLHSILVNGVLLGPEFVDSLREKAQTRRPLLDWLVPFALAAAASDADLERALEVASSPETTGSERSFAGFQGLTRIHQAESSLDEIIPAVSDPAKDGFQENEKNFLGEFTVGVERAPKRKKQK